MLRISTALLFCAAAHAATLNVNLAVNATLTVTSSAYTAAGTAKLTGGITDTGTFSASVPLSALSSSSTVIPYTITFPAGSMAGNLTIPIATILTSGSGTGSATVTSASGTYAGDTGTFPTVSGSGGIGTAITLTFSGAGTITTGGTVTNPPPTITAVLDAGSYTPTIAPGSIFVVKGSNLSASGYNSTTYNLPTNFQGTSISFAPTGSGTAIQPYLIYNYNLSGVNQLAAVLPSTTPAGTYNVTVTYNNVTSTTFPATVVAAKPAILTQDSTGNGLAVAQNIISATQYDLNRLTSGTVAGTTISPAKPGQTLVAYATGLGAVPGGDNIPSPGYDFTKNGVNVQVLVGGVAVPALYAGRAPGFSGLDQIDFTLPANIPTGCTVTLQIKEGSVTSAATTLSIAPSPSDNACVLSNFTLSQLQSLDQGGTYTTGSFYIEQVTETIPQTGTIKEDIAGGAFTQVTGYELGSIGSSNATSNTIGSCIVTVSVSGTAVAAGGGANLDEGAVTLTGPAGTLLNNTPLTESGNTYSLIIGEEGVTIPNSLNGKILAGTYTLNGAGGNDVTGFGNVAIILGTPLVVTGGLPATITESAGLTINWTGGNSTDLVQISGGSSTSSGTGANLITTTTSFVCTTTAGQGTFTIPSSVLTQVPPTTTGTLDVLSTPTPAKFSATLKSGATNVQTGNSTINGTFSALVGTAASVTYK